MFIHIIFCVFLIILHTHILRIQIKSHHTIAYHVYKRGFFQCLCMS